MYVGTRYDYQDLPVLTPSLGVMDGVPPMGVKPRPGVRNKLAPGVPKPAGVAPIGVLMPARLCAMLSCACWSWEGFPLLTACKQSREWRLVSKTHGHTKTNTLSVSSHAHGRFWLSQPEQLTHLKPLQLVLQLGQIREVVPLYDSFYSVCPFVFVQ